MLENRTQIELAAKCSGPDIIARHVGFKFAQIEPLDYQVCGDVKSLSQAPPKTEDNRRTQKENAAYVTA